MMSIVGKCEFIVDMVYFKKRSSMQLFLFVGVGGFLGAILRFVLSAWIQKGAGGVFPLGTLSVNVLGSFLIGFLVLYFQEHLSPEYRALVITGFLGALTTFSTFSYESVLLIEQEAYLKVFANVILNVVLSLSATGMGMLVFKKFFFA